MATRNGRDPTDWFLAATAAANRLNAPYRLPSIIDPAYKPHITAVAVCVRLMTPVCAMIAANMPASVSNSSCDCCGPISDMMTCVVSLELSRRHAGDYNAAKVVIEYRMMRFGESTA